MLANRSFQPTLPQGKLHRDLPLHFDTFGDLNHVMDDIDRKVPLVFKGEDLSFVPNLKRAIYQHSIEHQWDVIVLSLSKGMAREELDILLNHLPAHRGPLVVDATASTPAHEVVYNETLLVARKERLIQLNQETHDVMFVLFGVDNIDAPTKRDLYMRFLGYMGMTLNTLMEMSANVIGREQLEGYLVRFRDLLAHVHDAFRFDEQTPEEIRSHTTFPDRTALLAALLRSYELAPPPLPADRQGSPAPPQGTGQQPVQASTSIARQAGYIDPRAIERRPALAREGAPINEDPYYRRSDPSPPDGPTLITEHHNATDPIQNNAGAINQVLNRVIPGVPVPDAEVLANNPFLWEKAEAAYQRLLAATYLHPPPPSDIPPEQAQAMPDTAREPTKHALAIPDTIHAPAEHAQAMPDTARAPTERALAIKEPVKTNAQWAAGIAEAERTGAERAQAIIEPRRAAAEEAQAMKQTVPEPEEQARTISEPERLAEPQRAAAGLPPSAEEPVHAEREPAPSIAENAGRITAAEVERTTEPGTIAEPAIAETRLAQSVPQTAGEIGEPIPISETAGTTGSSTQSIAETAGIIVGSTESIAQTTGTIEGPAQTIQESAGTTGEPVPIAETAGTIGSPQQSITETAGIIGEPVPIAETAGTIGEPASITESAGTLESARESIPETAGTIGEPGPITQEHVPAETALAVQEVTHPEPAPAETAQAIPEPTQHIMQSTLDQPGEPPPEQPFEEPEQRRTEPAPVENGPLQPSTQPPPEENVALSPYYPEDPSQNDMHDKTEKALDTALEPAKDPEKVVNDEFYRAIEPEPAPERPEAQPPVQNDDSEKPHVPETALSSARYQVLKDETDHAQQSTHDKEQEEKAALEQKHHLEQITPKPKPD